MKYNITFLVRGPAGIVNAPNSTNPVEAENLKSLLVKLAEKLPDIPALEVTVIGLEIKPVY